MNFVDLIPALTTAVTVLGSVIAAFISAERGPREVQLISKLAEAAGNAPDGSPGSKAVDNALQLVASDYAAKVQRLRDRKVNAGSVIALILVTLIGLPSIYFLGTFAIWLGGLGGWAVVASVIVWMLMASVAFFVFGLLAAGSRTIYDPPKPRKAKSK